VEVAELNVGTLQQRTLERLDEDTTSPVYYKSFEVLNALDEAQRIFAFLTLCLEKTGSLALTANTTWYTLFSTFTDFLLPLRVRINGGDKLRPANTAEMDARNLSWQGTTGTPARYGVLGFDLFFVEPHPTAPGTSLDITFAHEPARLTDEADVPETPEEYHASLIDYTIPRLRAKEGADEFFSALPYLDRFLESAGKLGNYVRERRRAQKYDRLPFELAKWDRRKMIQQIRRAARDG
jgi:hypothetical protein